MNIKGNIKYIVTGSVLFLIIYLFVAAAPLKSELYFEPVWTRDISEPITWPEGFPVPEDIEPFVLGSSFGYFTPDGTILYSDKTDDRIAISDKAWSIFGQDIEKSKINTPDGTAYTNVLIPGNIHLDGDRTFLFHPGGGAVSELAITSEPIWTHDHIAPITAFDSSAAATIIGYADGKLVCVDRNGVTLFSFYPGGSDHQIILGAAISGNGKKALCLSGINQQRILLIDIREGQHKIVKHQYVENNLRRIAHASFETSGNWAFIETASGLGIIDCRKNSIAILPVSGQIISIGKNPGSEMFLILSRKENTHTITAVELPEHRMATTTFNAENAFLVQRENEVYLGTDTQLSKIAIRGLK